MHRMKINYHQIKVLSVSYLLERLQDFNINLIIMFIFFSFCDFLSAELSNGFKTLLKEKKIKLINIIICV